MDCKKMEELVLTDYIDGVLKDPGILKEVEAHLASCGQCRGLMEEIRSVSAAFKEAKRPEPSPIIWQRIREKISAAGTEKERLRLYFPRLKSPAIAFAAAVALILIILTASRIMPFRATAVTPDETGEILSMAGVSENGNGEGYDFGTPIERYFL